MPELERLKVRRDFLKVAAARRKWVTERLILQGTPRTKGEESPARVGFTVSKKVGNAVARNRAKRRLRALAAELGPELALPGWDYVLIGRHSTVECPFEALREDMRKAFVRLPTARLQEKGPSRRRSKPKNAGKSGSMRTASPKDGK